jgi:hypothetical protein
MIDYLVFFNVETPRNLNLFIGFMGQSPIEDVPNFFNFLADNRCDQVKSKFSDEGITCQIFQNYGNYFFVTFILIVVKLLISGLYHLLDYFKKDPLWLRKFHYKFLTSKFWFDYFDAIQLDLYLNAIIAIISYKGGTFVSQFNFIFSVAFLLCSMLTLVWIWRKIRFYQNMTTSAILDEKKLQKLFDMR